MFYVHRNDIVKFEDDVRRQFRRGIAAYREQFPIVIDAFGFANTTRAPTGDLREHLFTGWVPDALRWLSNPAYDGITFFVWPPAYNESLYLAEDEPGYPLTEWGEIARDWFMETQRRVSGVH
ncbi:hypothetical protein [Lutibaculum baratangense]|uniref:hypothetical protein n=1 Tax=Lutibaculum baratangense TaxID=1358440 RepID=UPI0012694DCD|nr:hypothetical protein [Lutibaculum baratangense]